MNGFDRDPMLDALKRTFEELDPVPSGLTEKILVAVALEDLELEYELLTMVHRSQQLAGVRSGDDQKLVLEFTDKVFHDLKAPDELFDRVSARFGHRQTAQLVLVIGFYMLVSRFLENFEVDIEPPGAVV